MYGRLWNGQWNAVYEPVLDEGLGLIIKDPDLRTRRFAAFRHRACASFIPRRLIWRRVNRLLIRRLKSLSTRATGNSSLEDIASGSRPRFLRTLRQSGWMMWTCKWAARGFHRRRMWRVPRTRRTSAATIALCRRA